jgi:hypothetical protein
MKPPEYMNGWNWSAPSTNQISPSALRIVRRASEAK